MMTSGLVADAHADSLSRCLRTGRSLSDPEGQAHLEAWRRGGVGLQVLAVWVAPERQLYPWALAEALRQVDLFWREVEAQEAFLPVLTRQDVQSLPYAGRVGLMLSLEGGEAVGEEPALLRTLARLGVRSLALTWNHRNALADGCGEERARGGLSQAGVRVAQEAQRLGMVLDTSHLSVASFWDLLEVTEGPVIASHSNARAVCDHPRNLGDEQIRAIFRRGGVVGLNLYPPFLRSEDRPATVEDVVRHAEHMASVASPAVVALGSDFDGIETTPVGLEDVSRLPVIAEALLRRGWSEAQVRGVLGENLRRVLAGVLPEAGWVQGQEGGRFRDRGDHVG